MSALATYTLLFVIVIGMAFVIISTHTMVIKEKSGAIGELSDINVRKSGTIINATYVSYTPSNLTIYYKNNGIEKLHLDRIALFVNDTKLLDSGYNIKMIEETNLVNSQLWDPGESINVTIFKAFSQRNPHYITVSAENGAKKKILFGVRLGSAITYNYTINALSPEAWWLLSSNGDDYSGNGHDSNNVVGSPSFVSTIISNPPSDNCLLIDAAEGYNYPDSTAINTYANPGGDYWAVSLWFNASSIATNNGNIIYEQGGSVNSIAVYTFNDSGNYKVYCSAVESANEDFVQSRIKVGEVYHLGCIWDIAGSAISMYINGKLMDEDTSLAIGSDLNRHTGDTAIAEPDSNPDNHLGNSMTDSFQGQIADIVLWGVNKDDAVSGENFTTIYKTGANLTEFWEID